MTQEVFLPTAQPVPPVLPESTEPPVVPPAQETSLARPDSISQEDWDNKTDQQKQWYLEAPSLNASQDEQSQFYGFDVGSHSTESAVSATVPKQQSVAEQIEPTTKSIADVDNPQEVGTTDAAELWKDPEAYSRAAKARLRKSFDEISGNPSLTPEDRGEALTHVLDVSLQEARNSGDYADYEALLNQSYQNDNDSLGFRRVQNRVTQFRNALQSGDVQTEQGLFENALQEADKTGRRHEVNYLSEYRRESRQEQADAYAKLDEAFKEARKSGDDRAYRALLQKAYRTQPGEYERMLDRTTAFQNAIKAGDSETMYDILDNAHERGRAVNDMHEFNRLMDDFPSQPIEPARAVGRATVRPPARTEVTRHRRQPWRHAGKALVGGIRK